MANSLLKHVNKFWAIILFAGTVAWAGISLHFNDIAFAKDLTLVKKRIEQQIKAQDKRQEKINKYLFKQAKTNGRVEANQEALLKLMGEIASELRRTER